jgi:signal transduction histidine kinase
MPSQETTGIALLCDSQGTVLKVLRDELGVGERIAPGQPWSALVDRGSLKKALNFLVELREKGAVFDWEINLPHQGHLKTLHFVGIDLDDLLLIVGAKSSNGVMALYEEMMRISNEQATALRRATKARSERAREDHARVREERGSDLYDEITRLNNELVAMQRELARKNAELERLNEQKNELLGMAAHDLRNPLHAILSYSDFLLEDVSEKLNEEQLGFLSIIQSSTEFMAALVNDLLDVAKIESGKLQLNLEPTDLPALVRQNVALNEPLARNKEIELRRSVESLPTTTVDPAKIEQVLNNLISNAIKYSPPNTTVDVQLRQDDGRAVLSVEDRGPGIPEDELDALFQPFQTTSVRATAGEKSTGLGLVITKRIVEGHGGEITVESEVGEGTTFTVELPLDGPRRNR